MTSIKTLTIITMAAFSAGGFNDQQSEMDTKSQNTKQAIKCALGTLKLFCSAHGIQFEDFENLTVDELCDKLKFFYTSMRNQKGEMYKRKSVTTIRYGIQKHFEKVRGIDIVNDPRFRTANDVYNSIIIKLKEAEKGLQKEIISKEDLDKLCDYFDTNTPSGLQNKVFVDFMLHFDGKGRDVLREMRTKDLVIRGEHGQRYVRLSLTDEHVGADDNSLTMEPLHICRMYEVPNSKYCPVAAFERYVSLLNPECEWFWQRPKSVVNNDYIWYEDLPLGKNTLGDKMKTLSASAKLSKSYSNHCLRGAAVTPHYRDGYLTHVTKGIANQQKYVESREKLVVCRSATEEEIRETLEDEFGESNSFSYDNQSGDESPSLAMAETSNPHEKAFVNPDHSSQVLYQLSELWRDKKLCDATIEVGPVKVYVHRLVLLAACPYLLTIGGQHDVPVLEVKLPMSVGLEGLNVFLTYLYDGTLHLTTSNLISVEKISRILRVAGIKKFCQEFREINESIILKDGIGTCDKFTTDYGLKMTDNSIQIIFSEITCNESHGNNSSFFKREAVDSDSFVSENKRRKMNIESLSPVLQHQSLSSVTTSQIQNPVCSDQSSTRLGKNSRGVNIADGDSSMSSGDLLPSEQRISIKQEPKEYSEVEQFDESETFLTPSGYDGNSISTDFVRQVPYSIQTFPSFDKNSGTSSQNLPTPSSSFSDSGVNHQSTANKYEVPLTYLSESNQVRERSGEAVNSQRILQKAVQSLSTGAKQDTAANEQMRTENWEMYMVRPLTQKKKSRTELPLEKKVELIRDFRVSPNTKQKHFAIKYGLGHSTVSDILKKGDFYLKQFEDNADLNKRRFHNSCKFEELNRFMWSWYLEAKARGVPVSGTLIQERALKYAQEQNVPDFKASNGWLQSWKSRYSIKSFKNANNNAEQSMPCESFVDCPDRGVPVSGNLLQERSLKYDEEQNMACESYADCPDQGQPY